jgi:hypothetical protein
LPHLFALREPSRFRELDGSFFLIAYQQPTLWLSNLTLNGEAAAQRGRALAAGALSHSGSETSIHESRSHCTAEIHQKWRSLFSITERLVYEDG